MISKCLFPVAGYGTRFLPATKSSPKEMLPVVNKPLIEYAVQEAVEQDLLELASLRAVGNERSKTILTKTRARGPNCGTVKRI